MEILRNLQNLFRLKPREVTAPTFLSWEQSGLGIFSTEQLEVIRDAHPDDLADIFTKLPPQVRSGTITELVIHGNYRKAAILARSFAARDEEFEEFLEERFDKKYVRMLLKKDLFKLR